MRWRIESVATAPEGHLYVVVALLDGDETLLVEDILLAVRREPTIALDENGWPIRSDGTTAYPWVMGDDGEWRRVTEDPNNPWQRNPADLSLQVLPVVQEWASSRIDGRGDLRSPHLAAMCSVRGDEPNLVGHEGTT